MSVVIDIDDTLIDTKRRIQGVWEILLETDVSMEDILTLDSGKIFMKYASEDQKSRVNDLRQCFWDLVLCEDERGVELARLDVSIQGAAEVLQQWTVKSKIVYLTGRTENTMELTLGQLERFGFPLERSALVMYSSSDYSRARGMETGPTLVEARAHLFGGICKNHQVIHVVDDYPGYFTIYQDHEIPDRIGFCDSQVKTPELFMRNGATRVIHGWRELLEK